MSQDYPPLRAETWRASALEGARASIAKVSLQQCNDEMLLRSQKKIIRNSGSETSLAEQEVAFEEQELRKALRLASSHHAGGRVVINFEKTPTTT